MGILDRAKRIIRSHVESVKENFDVDSISDYISGKVSGLTGDKEELSDEEVEEVLRNAGYFEDDPPVVSSVDQNELKRAYDRLGVLQGMTLKQIEKAYKKEMIKYHPDKYAGNTEKVRMATTVSQELGEALATIRKSFKE